MRCATILALSEEQKENKREVRKMKRMVKAALILMTILTVIFVSVVIYANVNVDANFHDYANSHRYVVYAAYKYEQDTPPTEWYTPEELGIVEVWELGNRAVQIVVDRRKEPFPFGPLGTDDQLTIFLYKDEFYTVSHRWVTFADGYGTQWQVPIGIALGAGWVITGALFLKWRGKE